MAGFLSYGDLVAATNLSVSDVPAERQKTNIGTDSHKLGGSFFLWRPASRGRTRTTTAMLSQRDLQLHALHYLLSRAYRRPSLISQTWLKHDGRSHP
jgi:hypothetical protein